VTLERVADAAALARSAAVGETRTADSSR
jgi:hypothetical protein